VALVGTLGWWGNICWNKWREFPQVQYASEFRYTTALTANTLVIGVTQSGETADTLAALTMEKQRRSDQLYQPRLGITNRIDSSLATLVNHRHPCG